jgi:hypothetical protein
VHLGISRDGYRKKVKREANKHSKLPLLGTENLFYFLTQIVCPAALTMTELRKVSSAIVLIKVWVPCKQDSAFINER